MVRDLDAMAAQAGFEADYLTPRAFWPGETGHPLTLEPRFETAAEKAARAERARNGFRIV